MLRMIRPTLAAAAALVFLSASPGLALERIARPFDDPARPDAWNAGSSSTILYYNTCTGWVWIVSGYPPNTHFGVSVDSFDWGTLLTATWHYVWTGAPGGYGFTGTMSIHVADPNECPVGAPLATQAFLPVSGWNALFWYVWTPSDFTMDLTLGPGTSTPLAFATDHPAAVAGGPPACGTCYPTTRTNHSFDYGTVDSPLCPPQPFLFDGLCDAQLLWDASLVDIVGVERESWGRVKALYR